MLGLDKEENQCSELSEKTMDILDNDVLVNLFVSTQKNNLDLCIKESIKLVIFQIYIFTLKNPQDHMEIWWLSVTLEQGVLIKYNIEKLSQRNLVLEIVIWFPNYWVRSLFVVKEK
jgi:hypothetical protein